MIALALHHRGGPAEAQQLHPDPGEGGDLLGQVRVQTEAIREKTRAEWERRIRLYYSSFPVIKDVPCDGCRRILKLRVYEVPTVGE